MALKAMYAGKYEEHLLDTAPTLISTAVRVDELKKSHVTSITIVWSSLVVVM